MKTLKQIIKAAEKNKVAVGHFNFAEMSVLRAAVDVAEKLKVPIIMGTSESERAFMGPDQAVTLVKSLRAMGLPIFINADHTKSLERVREAAAAGYDAILFDGGSLSFEENVKLTKEVVEYVKSINPDIIVEGELGYIGSSSKLLKEVPEGAAITKEQLTTIKEAKEFVEETKVDMLAPAVGNIHGMLVNAPEPNLDLARVRAIKKAVGIPLVLHGASGNTDNDVKGAIRGGVSIVHVSTEIRAAWRKALNNSLKVDEEEIAPYRILKAPREVAGEVIEKKLRVFNKLKK